MNWQPIETAPETGFFLVGKFPSQDHETTIAVVWWDRDKTTLLAYVDWDELPYLDGPATHWMPLPPPPVTP